MIWHNFCVVFRGRNEAPNLSESTAGSAHNDVRIDVPHTGQTAVSLFDRREHHGFTLNFQKAGEPACTQFQAKQLWRAVACAACRFSLLSLCCRPVAVA